MACDEVHVPLAASRLAGLTCSVLCRNGNDSRRVVVSEAFRASLGRGQWKWRAVEVAVEGEGSRVFVFITCF